MGVDIVTKYNDTSWASIDFENNTEMKFQSTPTEKMAALIVAPPVLPPLAVEPQESTTVILSAKTTMTVGVTVQRNPTMPLTKRDSLLFGGSRTSLISNGSTNSHSKVTEKDSHNTHPDMVAGKKRTPKKLERTNSYKRALNRPSANYDNIHIDVSEELSVVTVESDVKTLKKQDRKKYNTLPIKMTPPVVPSTTLSEKRREKKRDSDFQRNASQKSGTYPSPDTDEDQYSIQPERKKKSTFKRVKERLILTFRRHDREEHHKKDKVHKYKKHSHGVSRRVYTRQKTGATKGFHTPEGRAIEETCSDKLNNNSSSAITDSDGAKREHEDKPSKGKGSFNLFQTLRNSFRRKEAPQKYRTQKTQDPLHPIPESLPNRHPPNSSLSVTSDRHRQTQPISSSETPSRVVEEEPTEEEEDPITAFFSSIINTSSGSVRRPDRSKLNLEGLQKNRPSSFERKLSNGSARHEFRSAHVHGSDLSPTVETDGLDFADAVMKRSSTSFHEETSDETDFATASENEKQHMLDDVARRLAAIGDRIAAEKESESEMSASEVEGHLPGPKRQSSFERKLMHDLRAFADKNDFLSRGNVSITSCIVPVVKNIVAAHDYSSFKQIVQQELSNTFGWEQVAWYTYLMKTAVHIAGTGKKLFVNTMAKKYFSSKLKPFIESRPNGWESIHEETDVDTELD